MAYLLRDIGGRDRYLKRVAPPAKKYSSLDEQIRDYRQNMAGAGAEFPLFNELRRGEIRLESLVEGYEERFYELVESKKKGDEINGEVEDYCKHVCDLISFFNRLSGREIKATDISSYDDINELRELEKFDNTKTKVFKIGGGMFGGGWILGVISCIYFPLAAVPLLGITFAGGIIACCSLPDTGRITNYYQFNSRLRENARYVDSFIDKIYIQDFFLSNRERFKEVYPTLSADHQDYVDRKLDEMLTLGMIDMSENQLKEFITECKVKN